MGRAVRGVRGGKHANEDQRKMRGIWRTKKWKARVKELIEGQRCEWCNGIASTVNHKKQGYYPGYELCRRDEVDVVCKPCHQHWTKTGLKRHRLFDECSSCHERIYPGKRKKVCFNCGSAVIVRALSRTPEKKEQLLGIYRRCPEVCVGDSWKGVWAWGSDEIEIIDFEKQALPWPMVKTTRGEVGLPAFIFGELCDRGSGISWEDVMGFSREVK